MNEILNEWLAEHGKLFVKFIFVPLWMIPLIMFNGKNLKLDKTRF